MSDLDPITNAGDAWIHAGRTGLNTGSAAWVQVKSGERFGLVWPPLQSLAGRTVASAVLVGRVGPGHVAQEYTVEPITKRWSPGTVKYENQPTVNAAAAVTVTVGALPDGGLVTIPLTSMMAAVSAGTAWFGVRISTDSTAADQKFYSTDSGEPAWELLIELSDAPDQPTNPRPNGAAVSTSTPILAWETVDLGGDSTEQVWMRLQVDTPAPGVDDPDEVTPDFDTGWLPNVEPEFALATSGHTPAGDGPHFWRVMTKDAAGVESDWMDWAWYTVDPLKTLVVDSPVGPFGDPTPTLLAHLEDDDGPIDVTDVVWKAWVTGPDRSDIREYTGVQTGAIAWELPLRNADGRRLLREDEQGWIRLRVFDGVDRAVAVGENAFVEVWIPVLFDDDLGVQAPTDLTVVQPVPDDPRLQWTFALPEEPEAVLLQSDGVTVQRVTADELTAAGGYYTVLDQGGVSPMRPHVLQVRTVDNGSRSVDATHPVDHVHYVKGVWLLPDDGGDPIVLSGNGIGGFASGDRVATYTPLEGPEVDVIYDVVDLTGNFSGTVDKRQDVWATLARIEALRKSRRRVVRMVWGSQSIMARIADLHATSADDIMPTNLKHNVRFRFVQVGR